MLPGRPYMSEHTYKATPNARTPPREETMAAFAWEETYVRHRERYTVPAAVTHDTSALRMQRIGQRASLIDIGQPTSI